MDKKYQQELAKVRLERARELLIEAEGLYSFIRGTEHLHPKITRK